MSIVVRDLVKRYGDKTIIDKIGFEIAEGELVSLLGPSGCGKTTTLRCIAGLETPDDGFISIGGDVVFDAAKGIAVEPYHRDIGMVFQSYAIWPHLTVFENVAFPLRIRRRRAADIEQRVSRALAMVGRRSNSPAASSNASRWRAPSCMSRRFCCSMNRCPILTPNCGIEPERKSANCNAICTSPPSTSPTIRPRRCRYPIAFW
jgi:ABC-type ATPase involved in cell division